MGTESKSITVSDILLYAQGYASDYSWQPVSYYRQTGAITSTYCWFGNNGKNNSICIPIPAFSFTGNGTKLKLTLDVYSPEAHNYYWALCTSTAGRELYQGKSAVSHSQDNSQLGTGSFYLDRYSSGTHRGTMSFTISVAFPTGTPLYLYLWSKETGNYADHIYGLDIEATWEVPPPQGAAHIDTGFGWNDYTIWIDNGTAWQQYEAYVDTGSRWILCN